MAKRWLTCNVCAASWQWGFWKHVFKAPFHLFDFRIWKDRRLTKCPYCGCKSWIAREK